MNQLLLLQATRVGGFSGTPTTDSRFAVPCPSDRNAL